MKKKLLGVALSLFSLMSYCQIAVNEGFEAGTTPAGWTYSGFDRVTSGIEMPCAGNAAILSHLSSSLPTSSVLYSATNSIGSSISVSFKYRIVAANPSNPAVSGSFKVEYSQSGMSNNFQLVGSQINVTSPSVSCGTFTGNVSANNVNGNNRFKITANNIGTGDWKLIIDDVVIDQAIPCYTAMNLDPTNITGNSAQVNWFANGIVPANGIDIYYNTVNIAPTSTTIPTISGAIGSSKTINSLLAGTKYYVWVRSNCATEISDWSVSKTFTTLCSQIVPYNQNFETTALSTIPLCTTQQNGPWWVYPIESGLGFNQGRALGYNFGNSSTTNTWWYTPSFDLQGGVTYALMFKRGNRDLNAGNTQRLKVAFGISANSSAMTNIIKDFSDPIVSNSISEVLYFTPSTNGMYSIGFNGYTPSGVSGSGYLFIDDIFIDVAASCKTPGNITISSIVQTTATVNWEASSSNPAQGYDLYYSTNDTQPTSGTVPSYQGISGLSKNLSSLLAGRNYYVWVRSRCSSSEFSAWKQAVFATICVPSTTVPYKENFENNFSGSLPLCASVENTSTGTNWTLLNDYQSSSLWAGKALYLFFNSNTISNSSWFYTQGIYLEPGKQYKMTYLYGDRNTTGAGPVKLKVAYGTTPTSASMTSILFDHQTIPHQDQNSAQSTFTVPSGGIYYFGFNGYSSGAVNFIAVDNIDIVEDGILAVENVNKKENIAIYPNPFNDVLKISDIKDVKSIDINDILGNLIKTLVPKKELYLQDLNGGVYIISMKYNDGSVKTFKVIKK